jgi:hypothetical protein
MMHRDRVFSVAEVPSAEELAEKITGHTWTLCTGFRLGDLFFLNDSFSEDGAQEYAVIRADRQIETITFSWTSQDRALELIEWLVDGGTTDMGPLTPQIDDAQNHRCLLCA